MGERRETEHVTLTVPKDLFLAAERERAARGQTRSAFYTEGLASLLARLDEDEREQRDGVSGRFEYLAELVARGFEQLGELVEGSTEQDQRITKAQADRLANLLTLNWRATEMVYAMLKEQLAEDAIPDAEAGRRAGGAIRAKLERSRRGEEDAGGG